MKKNIILKNRKQELAQSLGVIITDNHLDSLPVRKLQRYKQILEFIIKNNQQKIKRFQEFVIKDEALIDRNRKQQARDGLIVELAKKGFEQNHIARRFKLTPARVSQIILDNN